MFQYGVVVVVVDGLVNDQEDGQSKIAPQVRSMTCVQATRPHAETTIPYFSLPQDLTARTEFLGLAYRSSSNNIRFK